MNYAPTFPLKRDATDGYQMITDIKDVVKFHLRNLLLTSKGEKISDPTYGVGVKRYLFEPLTPGTINRLRDEIKMQLSSKLQYLQINSIEVEPNEQRSSLGISITYRIPSIDVIDNINVETSVGEQGVTNIIF